MQTQRDFSRAQKGFTLIEVVLVLTVLTLIGTSVFTLLKRSEQSVLIEQTSAVLASADKAIAGFMAEHRRLPCPDTTGNGSENCGTGVKGWLPVATLGLDASAPVPTLPRIRYLASESLQTIGTGFEPSRWDYWLSSPVDRSAVFSLDNSNAADFCRQIEATQALAVNAQARVGQGADAHAVAWAIGLPGIDGAFSGLNQTGTPEMESPLRPADPEYDDQVAARTLDELDRALHCDQLTTSLHGMGLSVEVLNEVQKQWDATKRSAEITTGVNGVLSAVAVYKTVKASAALAGAVKVLGQAAAALAEAIASCVFIVGCAFIPVYSAAVAAAAVATGAAAAAVASSAAGLGLVIAATIEASQVAQELGASVPVYELDTQETLNSLIETRSIICAERDEARAAVNNRLADLDRANNRLTKFMDDTRALAEANYHPPGHPDYASVEVAMEAFNAWFAEEVILQEKQADLERWEERISKQGDVIHDLQDQVANPDPAYADLDPAIMQQALEDERRRLTELQAGRNEAEQAVTNQYQATRTAETGYRMAIQTVEDVYDKYPGRVLDPMLTGGDVMKARLICREADASDIKNAQCEPSLLFPPAQMYPYWYTSAQTIAESVEELKQVQAEKELNCTRVGNSVDDFSRQLEDPNFSVPPLGGWNDSDAILRRVDEKGGLQ